MEENRKINEDLLTMISGGTAAQIEELKQAILDNPNLARDWDIVGQEAARRGRPGDEIYIITKILDYNFGEVATLSTTEENTYAWASFHDEMLRQIREY